MTADTTAAEVAPQPLMAPPVTCGTPECPSELPVGWNYAATWQAAVDSRWGVNVIGLRMCPDCLAARLPEPGMYVPDAEIRAWIDGLYPEPDPHEGLEPAAERMAGDTAPVLFAVPAAEQVPADPPIPTAPAIPANPIAKLAAERHLPELPELDPAREKAMAAFNLAHDTEDGPQEPEAAEPAEAASADPAETSVMEPPTVIVAAVTDEGQAK